jgi:hypothetical protein
MSDFDLLIAQVVEDSSNEETDCEQNIQSVISVYNVQCARGPGNRLRMIAWDQK